MKKKIEQEQWKEILGYERYKVSNKGNVRSYFFSKEGKLVGCDRGDGYMVINLWHNKKCKLFLIHRLVAKAFIPEIDGKPFVNHIDGNPSNNMVENLEWCTQAENMEHADRTGILNKRIAIIQMDKEGNEIKRWRSAVDAANSLGLQNSKISCVVRGERKSSGGFIWRREKRILKFKIPADMRIGQFIFGYLEFIRIKYKIEVSVDENAANGNALRMYDPFQLDDATMEKLLKEYMEK